MMIKLLELLMKIMYVVIRIIYMLKLGLKGFYEFIVVIFVSLISIV